MKKLITRLAFAFMLLAMIILLAIATAGCTTSRPYPKYSSKECHWDYGTYKYNMGKRLEK